MTLGASQLTKLNLRESLKFECRVEARNLKTMASVEAIKLKKVHKTKLYLKFNCTFKLFLTVPFAVPLYKIPVPLIKFKQS